MPAALRRTIILIAALALTATIPTAASANVDRYKETSKSTFTLVPDEAVVHAASKVTMQEAERKIHGPARSMQTPHAERAEFINLLLHRGLGSRSSSSQPSTNVSISSKACKAVTIASDALG